MPRKMANVKSAHTLKKQLRAQLYTNLGISDSMTTGQLSNAFLKFVKNNPTRYQAQKQFLNILRKKKKVGRHPIW
jgi:hypothetical protein